MFITAALTQPVWRSVRFVFVAIFQGRLFECPGVTLHSTPCWMLRQPHHVGDFAGSSRHSADAWPAFPLSGPRIAVVACSSSLGLVNIISPPVFVGLLLQ
jgi:hypothetical protein